MTAKGGYSSQELAKAISPRERGVRGAVRRLFIRATKRVLWQLEGHRFGGVVEGVDAEPFTGIGFYSRPRTSSRAEAILESIGDAEHAVIVATRDEDLRKLWKALLDANPDVAAMFNSLAGVIVHGSLVEARSREGEAKSLAFAEKLQRLADDFYGHGHPSHGAGPIPTFSPPDPPGDPMVSPGFDGTEVLKGE